MRQVLEVGFSPGDRIGNYRVDRELGPAGSTLLIQAHHLVLPRTVLLKVVHPAFANARSCALEMLREACILDAITHPGVPIVYESGLLKDRRPWFAFEDIAGPTLEDLLAEGPLPATSVAALVRDLADILEHTHRRGVIHRGLRPERVVITAARRYPLCVPDWSEAIAHDATSPRLRGAPAGSVVYVAPELTQHGAGDSAETGCLIDDRVDMFALGAIAYRALTGRAPTGRDAAPQIAADPRWPELPRALISIIASLLAADRFDRPSASEVRSELDHLLGAQSAPCVHAADELAASGCTGPARSDTQEDIVAMESLRLRQPRWTPEIGYRETTDVDVEVAQDEHVGQ